MSGYLQIKGWSRFQHYSKRNPPWIKLHTSIFASEDWVTLDDASKLLAIVCMVVGSKDGGKVPNNPDYLKRVAYLNKRPDLTPLIACGFLENPLADDSERKQEIADARPEAEQRQSIKHIRSAEGFAEFWSAYPKRVGRKKAEGIYARTIGSSEATAEQLLAGAKRYAAECKGKEAQYIAHPATWLNAGRWADDATAGSATVIDLSEAAERERKLHEEALQKLKRGFTWPQFLGPAPGEPGCRVASDLVEKYRPNWDHFYTPPELKRTPPSDSMRG